MKSNLTAYGGALSPRWELAVKSLFPEYDVTTEKDLDEIWQRAIFVFDTNVLLNLYRYQETTREQLIEAISKLSGSVWIPHHVALEFQRNRVTVIADQARRFSEVRTVVEKAQDSLRNGMNNLQLEKRHSLIDPNPFLMEFDQLVSEFIASLDEIRNGQQELNKPDLLKERLESLFEEKVGPAPRNQEQIDKLYDEGKRRFAHQVPPGYIDAAKEKDATDTYLHAGIFYQRKYGDFLIWKQILEHASSCEFESLVFVTDDVKEDWWQRIKAEEPRTIGPRPELKDEMARVGGVREFLMFRPESFLKHSIHLSDASVSEETLQEVRDVSRSMRRAVRVARDLELHPENIAASAVLAHLAETYDNNIVVSHGFPDFIVNDDELLGFEVRAFSSKVGLFASLRQTVERCNELLERDNFREITIVLASEDESVVDYVLERFERLNGKDFHFNLNLMVGLIARGESIKYEFIPFCEIALASLNGPLDFF